jgi:adhesin transport system membrane fusion protein
MSIRSQLKDFLKEIKTVRANPEAEKDINKEDLEFVSSASEARLLSAPKRASLLILVSFIFIFVLLIWSLFFSVDEVVKASGKVIPSKQVQKIQSLEGGILKELKVSEGYGVQKGDILLTLESIFASSSVEENNLQYYALLAQYIRLDNDIKGNRVLNFPPELEKYVDITKHERERHNSEWDEFIEKVKQLEYAVDQKITALEAAKNNYKIQKQNYAYAVEELKLNEPLLASGAISKVDMIKIKQKVNEAKSKMQIAEKEIKKAKDAVKEERQKKISYIKSRINRLEKERSEVERKLKTYKLKGKSLAAKESHTVIKSPVTGIVKKIYIHTIGGVIRPGADIMEIVPTDDELLIEVKVKPKDIGFIHRGLKAKVKLTAYDFATYGGLDGKVEFISADTITDKKGRSYYLVRIRTEKNYIIDKKGIKHTIIPGMQTQVNIVVDKKSILSYIFKPLLK